MERKMKETGIPWIGIIPEDWKVVKNKQILRRKSVNNHPDEMVLSLYRDLGIVPKDSRDDNHNVTSEDTSNYKFVEVGDFVINKMKAWQGSMAVSSYQGIVSPAYHVCGFIRNDVDRKYLHYLLRDASYKPEYLRLSTGLRIGQWDLSIDDFLTIPALLPPLEEQQRIANFLDQKCAEVDDLIALQESMITELQAYKQSVITETVTRGLDPNAPLKDSGVEWIGKIPLHWGVSRVGMHYMVVLGKMLCPNKRDDSDTLNPYYCAANVHFDGISGEKKKMWFSESEKESYQVKVGDLLVVEGGAGAGGCAVVKSCNEYTYIQNSIMIVRPNGNNNVPFLKYYLESLVRQGYIDVVCNKATIPHFTKDKLSNVPYPVITLSEQQAIADFLDERCADIDALIQTKREKIESLKEYRKSIIYEYVTGKKQV